MKKSEMISIFSYTLVMQALPLIFPLYLVVGLPIKGFKYFTLKLSKYILRTSSGFSEMFPTTETPSLRLFVTTNPLKLKFEESTIKEASSFIFQSLFLKWKEEGRI